MKICIDIRCLSQGRRTGVEEYTLNLIRHIFECDKKNEYVLFFNSWKELKINLSWAGGYKNVTLKKFSVPNKILNLLFWYWDWPKIDRLVGGADIVYFPNIFFGSISRRAKTVVTVHDLSFERFPEFFSWKRRLWHFIVNPKNICRQADKIIAVSDSTKKDIISIYDIGADKIEVVSSGVSNKFRTISRNDEQLVKIKDKYRLPYKFILYLGTVEPRKNIIGLVRAYNQLQKDAEVSGSDEIKKYRLVIAGEKGWVDETIYREIRRSKFSQMIDCCGAVSDADKEYVYNLASIFAYPSFFEGFGFPPLEAMKCGVPVVSSNNSSIPEVVGNAGILIDPDRPEDIKKALASLILDERLKKILVERGLSRSQMFNWKNTAKKIIKIFNEMPENK